jgi:hypothetical protein
MKRMTLILAALLSTAVAGQAQGPSTGYAPVNGLRMYYESHGSGGTPLVLLHGSYMTITNNWPGWIEELSASEQVTRGRSHA